MIDLLLSRMSQNDVGLCCIAVTSEAAVVIHLFGKISLKYINVLHVTELCLNVVKILSA